MIPSPASRHTPYPLDRQAFRRRNSIERLLGELKHWRRVAASYDWLDLHFLAGLPLAADLGEWIRRVP